MDNFMDKLAKRFNAGEMIKANAQAEAREMRMMQERAAEYERMMQEMRRLNLKNVELTEQVQQLIQCGIEQFEGYSSGEEILGNKIARAAVMMKDSSESVRDEIDNIVNDNMRQIQLELQNTLQLLEERLSDNSDLDGAFERLETVVTAGRYAADDKFSEVSGLIMRADENIREISGLIGRTDESVREISGMLGQTDESVRGISGLIGRTDENVREISGMVGRTDESVREISGMIGRTDESVREISGLVGRTDESVREVSGLIGHTDETIQEVAGAIEQLDASLTSLREILVATRISVEEGQKRLEEHVHKENVRVYRNVQAVIVEEMGKKARDMGTRLDYLESSAKKNSGMKPLVLLTLLLALASLGIQVAQMLQLF
ncbi:MAG: hypothetical protein HDR00_06540 [Lachnospiraceae bacterium]|nr:hypothetical protein [Lachnospiraceae bacterium]